MTRTLISLTLSIVVAAAAGAVDFDDVRLLADPALSRERIAFTYDNDLWVADRDGRGARRLTSHEGVESNAAFSPDGRWIAFSGEYDGNVDVYVVAAEGGAPRRLTYHPGLDRVEAFTPDGEAVVFSSQRQTHTNRHHQFFRVPIAGGFPTRLPVPHGLRASFSADGRRLAYVPIRERHEQWKHYRGGTQARIWVLDLDTLATVEIPKPAAGSNDTDPMWIGDQVYFRSDRDGELNLYRWRDGGAVERLTDFSDFPVLAAEASDSTPAAEILLEQGGYLHRFVPATGEIGRLRVSLHSDLKDTRPRLVGEPDYIRSASISPSGARVAFGYRGEILTLPAEKGPQRNLTSTPGVHEREPAWSPDGRWVAYVSDQGGEYGLHIAPQDGRGEVRRIAVDGAGFYEDLRWSPDSEHLSFSDNSWSLYVLDVGEGRIRKVASEAFYGPQKTLQHSWSPDSRWLAYTLQTDAYLRQVHFYDTESGVSHPVTDGLSDAAEPVFDASGKYLYFLASTDAGPARQWFAMSNADMDSTYSIYLAVLAADEESPLAPEIDEEEIAEGADAAEEEEEEEEEAGVAAGEGEKTTADEEPEKDAVSSGAAKTAAPPDVVVDLDGLSQRIVALPLDAGHYSSLQAGRADEVLFLERTSGVGDVFTGNARFGLRRFSLESREQTTVAAGVVGFTVAAKREKLLLALPGDRWSIVANKDDVKPADGALRVDAIDVRIDPRAEWAQIFDEAWRINRDYFYDPGMHGADWPAMRDKYRVFLPDLTTRRDLNRVLQWMSSELSVGHHNVGGGDERIQPERVSGGLLGADFEIDSGRYRLAKVFGGLNWNPDLRAPLTEPGVGATAGEYILAIEGQPLTAAENIYSRLEATAGQRIEIELADSPDGAGSRTVAVVPIPSESALRNRDWVEGNLRRVDEATDGRVAYVYVPNTANLGHTYFKRYFFPQAQRQAIIVDERFNGGGQVADYYIDHLRRPYIASWALRYGRDLQTPSAAIHGPKVMIIDETAGSGGDLLPWMFHELELGTLVGKRTWGGLVGILGFPVLMDGGQITAPNLAIWTEDGFVVENAGVPPDVEVEQWPAEVLAGHDPQLEKAIEIVLEQLEASPPPERQRPPYPKRALGEP